jgi:hypothetical protein
VKEKDSKRKRKRRRAATAKEKATVEETQDEAKEKEQAEISERVIRWLLPTLSDDDALFALVSDAAHYTPDLARHFLGSRRISCAIWI